MDEWRRRAETSAALLRPLPPRLQLSRLAEDDDLLDAAVVAAALGLLSAGTSAALESPRLAPRRRRAILRVHAALTPLVPPRVGPHHWIVGAVAEVRRQAAAVLADRELGRQTV